RLDRPTDGSVGAVLDWLGLGNCRQSGVLTLRGENVGHRRLCPLGRGAVSGVLGRVVRQRDRDVRVGGCGIATGTGRVETVRRHLILARRGRVDRIVGLVVFLVFLLTVPVRRVRERSRNRVE